jgi:streptomycin 6-kinase
MIGRFIFECDTKYFVDAARAAEQLIESADKQMMLVAHYDSQEVFMFADRLKKSIRVRQVKP